MITPIMYTNYTFLQLKFGNFAMFTKLRNDRIWNRVGLKCTQPHTAPPFEFMSSYLKSIPHKLIFTLNQNKNIEGRGKCATDKNLDFWPVLVAFSRLWGADRGHGLPAGILRPSTDRQIITALPARTETGKWSNCNLKSVKDLVKSIQNHGKWNFPGGKAIF